MNKLVETVRLLALSIIFGGSIAIVFVVINIAKEGHAAGLDQATIGLANAPLFIHFSKLAMGAAIALIVSEVADFFTNPEKSKCTFARYGTSVLSAILVLVFALGLTAPMAAMLPQMKTDAEVGAKFDKLHHVSQPVLGTAMLLAIASLAMSGRKKKAA